MVRSSKFVWSCLLCLLVMISLIGCSQSTSDSDSNASSETSASFKAGTYTASAAGNNGDLTVEVVFDETSITSVTVKDHKETEGLSDTPIERIPQQIVEGQTLAADVVSGATNTSNAILAAVEDCVKQAGGDVEALKANKADKKAAEKITKETDVVVVGSGIAGLAAAVEAADAGAKVVLLEKMPAVGGSTIRSGGLILAAESSVQKAAGIEDTAEAFADFLWEIGEHKVDRDFVNLVAQSSGENIEWLIENGVEFSSEIVPLHSYRSPARGHHPESYSGSGFIFPLQAKAKELGVEILLETPAVSLIHEDGKVKGVKATNLNEDEITVHAKTVILATGGFDRNPDLIAEYYPSAGEFSTNVGDGNTGDGLLMAKEVGAQTLINDAGIRLSLNIPTGFGYGEAADGLFVTPKGERFMDEKDFHFTRTRIMYDEGIDHCYYIFDESDYNDQVGQAIEAGTAYEAATIEELAEKINMDPAALKGTFDRYNELAKKGKDDDFNKPAQFMTPIENGKLYAVKMSGNTSGTIGGLKTTIHAQVLDMNDRIIPGLYAAGEVANGQIFYREYPGSGSSIIAGLTFGRQAGAFAAQEALN